VIGFFVMLMIVGWEPHERHKPAPAGAAVTEPAAIPSSVTNK